MDSKQKRRQGERAARRKKLADEKQKRLETVLRTWGILEVEHTGWTCVIVTAEDVDGADRRSPLWCPFASAIRRAGFATVVVTPDTVRLNDLTLFWPDEIARIVAAWDADGTWPAVPLQFRLPVKAVLHNPNHKYASRMRFGVRVTDPEVPF